MAAIPGMCRSHIHTLMQNTHYDNCHVQCAPEINHMRIPTILCGNHRGLYQGRPHASLERAAQASRNITPHNLLLVGLPIASTVVIQMSLERQILTLGIEYIPSMRLSFRCFSCNKGRQRSNGLARQSSPAHQRIPATTSPSLHALQEGVACADKRRLLDP